MSQIKIEKYLNLPAAIKQQMDFYIRSEFGHIPIVKETKWSAPDWTVINFIDDDIATFYNIVERTVLFDNKTYSCAGINNVITPEKYRGKGLASNTLSETETFLFHDLKVDIGILLCADNLVPFYERLKWYKINCPVYFDQPDGKKRWQANTMLLNGNSGKPEPGEIDLQGLPW